ncbi:hypothetical protein TTHERM_00048890 (macronuclear) [Tetrahymena thermophila SB210]|uniref:Uncharacterized protein n=1 Tax=Tetrahymena thermophila (strain SB210) TaxID=312017 RepID=Q23DA1_TETTS|nr:hypothetical protein TTHERM_00048890 [Tetrahymena thermophila SB210]EAR94569.1 hypothetical protein TTHERM_00048890 [Tetrahymena thermophila SB210]|eukprot:XP_001014785.1 hypothetical protein TTHERM_00048890 [Tetrahymena thermophila SB210]
MITKKNSFINDFFSQISDIINQEQQNKLFKYLTIIGINAFTSTGQNISFECIKKCAKSLQNMKKKDLQEQVSQLKQQIQTLTKNVTNTLNGGSDWINGKNSTQIKNESLHSNQVEQSYQNPSKDGQKFKKTNFEGLDIQEINRLFYENIEQRNFQLAHKLGNSTNNQQEFNQNEQKNELNIILSPKNTLKKMSFDNSLRKQSHSTHTAPVSNASQTQIINNKFQQKKKNENLYLNSFAISQSEYPNSLEQNHPLTSCKNSDGGQLKLMDFSSPSLNRNTDNQLNNQNRFLKQIAEKNNQKNKENLSYLGNLESKENLICSSQFEENKRKSSLSPLKSSQNNLVQSQTSNLNSQVLSKKDQKKESSTQSRSRKNQHQNNNYKMYKQPCQKNVNRSKSNNPSRSNSRTPRNSKSPSVISFNGSQSFNQIPSYLRNVQSKIKDQIEFHKELKKKEAKLGESQQNLLISSNQQKSNQEYSQSQRISPSSKFQNSQGSENSKQFFNSLSQNEKQETSFQQNSFKNPNKNSKVLVLDNSFNQSNLNLNTNNSTKNNSIQGNQNQQLKNSIQNEPLTDQPKFVSKQSFNSKSQLYSNQNTDGTTQQTTSNLQSTINQQQETLFTGHFRTKSNISEYQITTEEQSSIENHFNNHQNLRHNQIKNMYNTNTNFNYQNSLNKFPKNTEIQQNSQFKQQLETNNNQIRTQNENRYYSTNQTTNFMQQQNLTSPKNFGIQQMQISHNQQRKVSQTPIEGRRQSGGSLHIDHLNENLQETRKQNSKKNVLELATNFLKSPIMQQLCNTKQQQEQNIQQNQEIQNSMMHANIKQIYQNQLQQGETLNYYSDNGRNINKKQEQFLKDPKNNQYMLQQQQQQQQQSISQQASIQEQLQEQMKKLNYLPKKHPCDQTLSPQDLQLLLQNQNPNISITSNYQSASFGNSKNSQANHNFIGQSQTLNYNVSQLGNNALKSSFTQIPQGQNGEQSMVASSLFSSFNPSNETKGFFQNDFEKRMNDLGKSSNSRKQQNSQNDASSNISFNADLSNNLIQPQIENPFY